MLTWTSFSKQNLPLFLVLLLSGTVQAQLNGTYTIGGAAPDYATISDAVDDLDTQGLDGPVTFRIRAGTYDEQVFIPLLTRTGDFYDPVVFKAANPGSPPVWQYSGATTDFENYIVHLNYARDITFENIIFNTSNPPYGRHIVFSYSANSNTIRNCTFNGTPGAVYDGNALIFSEQDITAATFLDNTFNGGSRGIEFQSSTRSDDLTISNNTFTGQTGGGIRLENAEDILIENNAFLDAPASIVSWVGIHTTGDNLVITRNTIDTQNGEYGIYMRAGLDRMIANNMINMRGTATVAGIYMTNDVKLYHNTVRVSGSTSLATPLLFHGTSSFDIVMQNNIFLNESGAYAMQAPVGVTFISSDYNNFYTANTALLEWQGVPMGSLAPYQAASGVDLHSIERPVTFVDIVGPGDLHLSGASLGNPRFAGDAVAEVTLDIDGQARDAYNPYMGADEATPALSPFDNADTAAGYYTIGGTSPNFGNPSLAITHLNYRGIKGKTTFRIRAGTYEVNRVVRDFPRKGPAFGGADTVLFRASNPEAPPTLRYAATSADDNWVLQLDGADLIRFLNIDFVADGAGPWGNIIVLQNSADDHAFSGCSFTGLTGETDKSAALIYNAVGDAGDRNHFLNNTFTNGSYGFYLDDGGGRETIIEANTFTNAESSSILTRHDDITVIDNKITGSPTSDDNGIYVGFQEEAQILRNQILMPGPGARGLMLVAAVGAADALLVANNFITAPTGIRVAVSSSGVHLIHNTIYATGPYALEVESGSAGGLELKNNILYNQGTPRGYALHVEDAADVTSSDYNILYNGSASVAVVHWAGTDYLTFDDFQTATGLEPHSVAPNGGLTFEDVSTGDLHIALASATDFALGGLPVPEITEDIDGEVRGSAGFPVPYIGADERLDVGPLGITGNLKVFLSGPYEEGTTSMKTDLNSTGMLDAHALTSPYADCETETVAAGFFATNPTIVDWVCVRLLTGDPLSPPMTEVANRIAFVDADGNIVKTSGSGDLFFALIKEGYYVVVEHRNHLAVMSADPVDFNDATGFWDTRSNLAKAYTGGGVALQDVGSRYAMWGGDGDANGSTSAFDFLNEWLPINGAPPGYDAGDFDMNGSGTAFDFLTTWLPANGQASQVP